MSNSILADSKTNDNGGGGPNWLIDVFLTWVRITFDTKIEFTSFLHVFVDVALAT